MTTRQEESDKLVAAGVTGAARAAVLGAIYLPG